MAGAKGREDLAEGQRSQSGWVCPYCYKSGLSLPSTVRALPPRAVKNLAAVEKKLPWEICKAVMFKGEPGIQGASEARNIPRRWEAEGDRFTLNLRKKLPRD